MFNHRVFPRVMWSLAFVPALAANAQTAELAPIEVTATRTALTLPEVSAAVTVLDGDDLARGRALTSLVELLDQVPGLYVQNAGNAAQDARLALRGFGARSSFGIRGVAIVVDGIPQTLPDGQSQVDSIDLDAIERIEILRGPASVLYGNAAGGVILITTRQPDGRGSATVGQTVGSYGLVDTRLSLSGGNDRLGVRFSASRFDQDGFRRHSAVRQYRAQTTLAWTPSERTRVTGVAGYFETPEEQDPGAVTAALARTSPRAARPANVQFDAGESLEQWRFGAGVEHAVDARQRVRLSGFGFLRDFENRLPFASGGQVAFERTFTGLDGQYEIDADWGGIPQRLTTGFDYRRQDDDRLRFDNLQGIRGDRVLDQNEQVDALGLYAQHRIRLAPDWTLRLGVRFDEVRLDVDDRLLVDGDDSGRRTWRETSPGAGLVWSASSALSIYASAGTAFQTPTTTELANPEDPGAGGGFNRALDPQTARSYELGLRGAVGTGLRYEASVFRARIDNAITSFEVPEFSGSGRDFFRNAGRSTRNGLELAASARLGEDWRLRGGYTYSDFEFDRFSAPDGDFSGNRLPGVPRHYAFGALDWSGPAGFYAGLDLRAASEVIADNANTAASPDYVVVDAHVGRNFSAGRLDLDLSAGLGNLFDERYIDNVRVNAFGGRYFEPAPGTTFHVGLEARWRR
ncbi:MAG TPA: TonB-dependent receptor [Wenzhouxiangellaceae bacterium]|nr:TonB-dependent receptor [Wenzhouxiangellaceae bacterium]